MYDICLDILSSSKFLHVVLVRLVLVQSIGVGEQNVGSAASVLTQAVFPNAGCVGILDPQPVRLRRNSLFPRYPLQVGYEVLLRSGTVPRPVSITSIA